MSNKSRVARRLAARSLIVSKKTPCFFCGEREPCSLDFHHINPSEKEFGVGDSASKDFAQKKILEEINKCVCVCSNCHRKLHWLIEKGQTWISKAK